VFKKFNILDIAILIIILSMCFGGLIYLIKSATADIKTIIVTVTVGDDIAENITQGDKVFFESGEELGTVTAIRALGNEKAIEITVKRENIDIGLKPGQPIDFRTGRIKAEGKVYSIKTAEAYSDE
jgi:ASC-1-like (ASCH) protein